MEIVRLNQLQPHLINQQLLLRVIPNSSRTKLVAEPQLKLYLQAIPDKNRANIELMKFFKKQFGLRVEIKSGLHSREKVIRVL